MRPESRITPPQVNGHQVNGHHSKSMESPQQLREGRYRHILLPTRLMLSERPALELGMQLAAAQQARVTILHVISAAVEGNSLHWLDAIDNLYDSMSRSERVASSSDLAELIGSAREKVLSFLTNELRWEFHEVGQMAVVCRIGDVADEIVRFANEDSVDLVVLTSPLGAGWWSPGISERVQQVLSKTQRQVAVVRPAAVSRDNKLLSSPT